MNRVVLLFFMALICLAVVLSGCQSSKLPAGDVEVLRKYRTEVEILRDPKIKANTKIKFDAAKIIFDNVDFSYARNYDELEQIFGNSDVVGKTRYGGKKSLVYAYSWEDQVIQADFFFSGQFITGVKVKETTFDPSNPHKIKSFNTIQRNPKSEWKVSGAK